MPVRTRVGHSFIKAKMAETGAVFGGEHSGHYYFRDFWFADSGMLAALHVLAALGEQDAAAVAAARRVRPVRRLRGDQQRGRRPGRARPQQVARTFAGRPGVTIDELDGLTVSGPTWWFNLRPSNTEPLLRLNVEAADRGHHGRRCGTRCSASGQGFTPTPAVIGRIHEDRRLAAGDPGLPRMPRAAAGRRGGQRAGLHQRHCGLAYPVRDDIPVLLVDEARRPGRARGP